MSVADLTVTDLSVARQLALLGAVLLVGGHPAQAAGGHAAGGQSMQRPASTAELIRSAESAAPIALSSKAAVVLIDAAGNSTVLRQGSNNFTCLPDSPSTPGPDPMCGDANAMEWAGQWIGHKPPNQNKPGFMYMLAGGTDASNTDPWAKGPSPGDAWIETGPHVMLVGIGPETLAGYLSGPRPDTRQPYVMWAGTPYAHLMLPVR
ncbi:hypothetical protein [Synechococcus sp. GFB01]|uniref:hypothetical protein n=1 Tax=Synechococcus sp. GFB01 TaxID=1662190 RepID=UPI00128C9779|nr:hypothetical protein [Synechococcus sp. GFB01]